MVCRERLVHKRFLTSGGRLVTKSYLVGKGIKEVNLKKDVMGRYRVLPVRQRGMGVSSVSRSVPKSMSRRKVMDEISSSLHSMSMGSGDFGVRRGRGVVRF